MAIAQQVTSVAEMRNAAVAEAMSNIRAVELKQGVNPETLEEIKSILRGLAAGKELFPSEDFPIVLDERGQNPIYRLSEDGDNRFALYMSCSKGAKKVPPHNHTTWAVIVGVQGDELNCFYERSDDGSIQGKGTLREIGRQNLTPGVGACLMPEDIHHIETHGETHTMHLHMYGLALDHLHERVMYNVEEGSYRVFPASQNIRDVQ